MNSLISGCLVSAETQTWILSLQVRFGHESLDAAASCDTTRYGHVCDIKECMVDDEDDGGAVSSENSAPWWTQHGSLTDHQARDAFTH